MSNHTMDELRKQTILVCPRCKKDEFKAEASNRQQQWQLCCINCDEEMFRYGFFVADVLKETEREEEIVTRAIAKSRTAHSIDDPIPLSKLDWLILRQIVFLRDDYQCQCKCTSHLGIRCSTGTKNLDVHHIKPKIKGGTNDIDNLITLCRQCHATNEPVKL